MVVGVEPSIYVWNADIAESALRQHQGQGAIDGDDDDDKNDDDNSWNEWEDLKAEARQAPIIIEGERVALGLVVDVDGSIGDHHHAEQHLLKILKQDTYSAALRPKNLTADDNSDEEGIDDEKSNSYHLFEDIANPFGGGSAIGLAHSILCVRKVAKQQYLIAIETLMILTQKKIKSTLDDDVECVLCVTQVETSTDSSLLTADSISSDGESKCTARREWKMDVSFRSPLRISSIPKFCNGIGDLLEIHLENASPQQFGFAIHIHDIRIRMTAGLLEGDKSERDNGAESVAFEIFPDQQEQVLSAIILAQGETHCVVYCPEISRNDAEYPENDFEVVISYSAPEKSIGLAFISHVMYGWRPKPCAVAKVTFHVVDSPERTSSSNHPTSGLDIDLCKCWLRLKVQNLSDKPLDLCFLGLKGMRSIESRDKSADLETKTLQLSLDESLSIEEQSMLEEALKFARGPKEESTKEIDQQHRREATDKDRLDVLTHIWQDRIRYIGCLEAGYSKEMLLEIVMLEIHSPAIDLNTIRFFDFSSKRMLRPRVTPQVTRS